MLLFIFYSFQQFNSIQQFVFHINPNPYSQTKYNKTTNSQFSIPVIVSILSSAPLFLDVACTIIGNFSSNFLEIWPIENDSVYLAGQFGKLHCRVSENCELSHFVLKNVKQYTNKFPSTRKAWIHSWWVSTVKYDV